MRNPSTRRQKLLAVGAATALFFGAGGYFIGKPYLVKPAHASCGGHVFTGNPGNNMPVGMAGEHPPGGGGHSVTGDRGGSR